MDEIPRVTPALDGGENAVIGPAPDASPTRSAGGLGAPPKADTMLRRFGASLYALAYVLTEDRGRAEQMVLQAIFTRPAVRLPRDPRDSQDVLRDLARLVYLHWSADTDAKSLPPHPSSTLGHAGVHALCARLSTIPHEHRVALAMCAFGGHSYRQTAGLLKLPPACVAEVLLEAPHDLNTAVENWEAVSACAAGTGRTTSTEDCSSPQKPN